MSFVWRKTLFAGILKAVMIPHVFLPFGFWNLVNLYSYLHTCMCKIVLTFHRLVGFKINKKKNDKKKKKKENNNNSKCCMGCPLDRELSYLRFSNWVRKYLVKSRRSHAMKQFVNYKEWIVKWKPPLMVKEQNFPPN